MLRDVFVIGVGMAPFGRGHFTDLGFDASVAALDDAAIRFDRVESVYLGTLSDPLSPVDMLKDVGMTGVSATAVNAASATGSAAFRMAVRDVAGGLAEVSMAIGLDDLDRLAQQTLDAGTTDTTMFPASFFSNWATRRMHEAGTTIETLAAVAAKNWNHGRSNSFAQRQSDHEVTVEEVLASRMIASPHTSMMACAQGAGGATAIVASRQVVEQVAGGRPMVRVVASQQQTEQYTEGHVFLGAVVGPPELSSATATAAYEEAGIGPADIDLAQVHDAFAIEELMYYELLGFCGEGEGDKLVATGETALGGRIPFSTDGGLIARGHAGGPTGLAQIWETTCQLRGESGARQVEGARTGLAMMMGGGAHCVTHILQRA